MVLWLELEETEEMVEMESLGLWVVVPRLQEPEEPEEMVELRVSRMLEDW
jgi:hypothetical protein